MTTALNDASVPALLWSTLEVRGADAEAFLQGQLSQDLRHLDSAGAWTLLLAPDSVVLTSGFVTPVDEGFDVVVPRELAEVAHARLRRFLLRAACTVSLRDSAAGPFATLDEQIDAAWPGANEFAASLTPHSFGRRFVATTISFDKGCFTGQELVGRLDARGASVPWRLVRASGPDAETINAFLASRGPEGPQGLTSARVHEGRVEGLGFAHRTLISTPVLDADVSVVAVE
jgi:folate-binding Fe-S cluster repair protein YgfZ